ncbi:CFAP91, partial [Symbiodinium sp. CCMP2456]
ELLRFQEERRIAAMVKLAERDRQDRQAMESGRRQAEERLRAREDEMFRQIMGVHQGTVDSYLEEVLTNTVEQAAQSRALTEARLKAAKINQVVDMLEASAQEPEVVVRELVHSFNLPHVQREVLQRRVAQENQRFSEAARGALDETYKKVTENVNPST